MNIRILWIARTAVLTALLISMQAITSLTGNTLITGSVVNAVLIISVMISGVFTGLTVAVISPVVAKFIGIGPLWSLIPFIMLGNVVLVLIWYFVGRRSGKKSLTYIVAIAIAAVAKFIVLYLGIVKIAIPLILRLQEPQASMISGLFSIPQLFTALAGGAIAAIILPFLQKAIKTR